MTEQLILGRKVRGLTLWRPWPWCFTHADKRVENRPWALPEYMIDQFLALHSGKKFDLDAAYHMREGEFGEDGRAISLDERDHPHSVITALAVVTRSYKLGPDDLICSRWHFGPHCWPTPEVITLPEPVPCKGAQGLWHLPPDVFEAVSRQVEVTHG